MKFFCHDQKNSFVWQNFKFFSICATSGEILFHFGVFWIISRINPMFLNQLLIPLNVFSMFVKCESVALAEVRELDFCRPHISALFTKLVYLLIINVCNASHEFLESSTSACWAFCSSAEVVRPHIMKSLCFANCWFSHAVCASASASEGVGHPLSTNVSILRM